MDYDTLLKQYHLLNDSELSPLEYLEYFSTLSINESEETKIEEYQTIIESLLEQEESGNEWLPPDFFNFAWLMLDTKVLSRYNEYVKYFRRG